MKAQMNKFRVGIIGAGYVSAHHLRALGATPNAEVVAIADLDLIRAQAVARQFGVPQAFGSVAELLQQRLDVVHVLTTPESHCALALQALEAGCHVMVEKPMAETEADCRRMIEAAARAGRTLTVNHSARLDPVVQRAAEMARQGACGDIVSVFFLRTSDYPPYRGGPLPPAYRKGSYPFQDLGIHGLSIMESFLGPVRHADIDFRSTARDINLLFDEWRATVECEKGVGQMHISWNARPVRSELFIQGTRGSIHVDCFLQTVRLSRVLPGPKFLTNVGGRLRGSFADLFTVPMNVLRFATGRLQGAPGIHVSIQQFYKALAVGATPEVTGEEGRRIIAAMEMACSHADEARAQVRAATLAPLLSAPVLVTGASGFIGRRLVARLLQHGRHIRVLVRHAPAEWRDHPLVQVVEGDLGDPEIVAHAMDGVRRVFHVGAAMKGGAADFERGTVVATRNVIAAALQNHVERLVYVSSLSVLDQAGHVPDAPVTESSPYEPNAAARGLYTQTKLEAERMVLGAIAEQGLPAVVLRPGQIFGPGAERVTPAGVIGLGGRWLVVGNGGRLLPLVYVEDVIDALLLAEERPEVVGRIYNIVDTEPITQRQYLEWLAPKLGGIKVRYAPPFVLNTLALVCEAAQKILKRPLPLSRYRIRSIRPLAPFDCSAAQQELGWQPAVGSSAGLQAMSSGREERKAAPETSALPAKGGA